MKLHLRQCKEKTMAKNCCSFSFCKRTQELFKELLGLFSCLLIITINLNEMKFKWLIRILIKHY